MSAVRQGASRVAVVVLLALVSAVSAAAAGADPGTGAPGSSPANPITVPGAPVYGPTHVHVWWPDGSSATVDSNQPPSLALDEATIASLSKQHPAPKGASPNVSWGGGASACSETLAAPYKLSSTKVGAAASVSCTSDVYSVGGTLYLYRSANFTLIGSDTEHFSGNFGNWSTSGGCLSSTWQYNDQTSFSAISSVNGGINWGDAAGPSWISC
jgi:hypothetical protein